MSTCPLGHDKDEGQSCAECAAAWQRYVSTGEARELEKAARLLALTVTDDVLQAVKEYDCVTNMRVLEHWRDEVLKLAPHRVEEPPQ